MMKKIENMARRAYWSKESRVYGIASYTAGYKDGFIQAIKAVQERIATNTNNKARLEAIEELIKEVQDAESV